MSIHEWLRPAAPPGGQPKQPARFCPDTPLARNGSSPFTRIFCFLVFYPGGSYILPG
jgi:hypothetical protein